MKLVDVKGACSIIGGDNPIHTSTLWKGIRKGKYPKPIAIGPKIRRWIVDELESIKKIDVNKTIGKSNCKFSKSTFPIDLKDRLINITNQKPLSGIYFLFKEQELLYIGQSINVHNRIRTHKNDPYRPIKFDEVLLYPCDEKNLIDHETILIRTFNPPLNRKY